MVKTSSQIADEVLEKVATVARKTAWRAFISRARSLGLQTPEELEPLVAKYHRAAAKAETPYTPLATELSRTLRPRASSPQNLVRDKIREGDYGVVKGLFD